MRKAWLIAWREITWEILGDRGALLRQGVFLLLPVGFVLANRGAPPGRLDGLLVTLAAQSVLLPAISGVALIASTFVAEKENGTLVPLLAAPIRDLDIVVGKLLGMLIPVTAIALLSLAVFYAVATATFGTAAMQRALTPQLLYALMVVALLYLLTTGSWVMVVAARVRTSRGAQQISGLLIAGGLFVFATLGALFSQLLDGYGLVGLGLLFLATDLLAIEIARRGWQRGEVVARL